MLHSHEIKVAIEDSTKNKWEVKDAVEKQAVNNGVVNSLFEWNIYLNRHLKHLTEMCDSCNAAMKMS